MMIILAGAALQVATIANPVPADWRARPLTAGSWSWRGDALASEAMFSDPRGVQLVLRCVRATRRVMISRTGTSPSVPIRIATTSSQRVLPPGNLLLGGDPLLDAIAFSRGRLWVEASGAMPLIVRAAAEPARAIEDCRS